MFRKLIVLSVDDAYVVPCEIFIQSLVKNTPITRKAKFLILYDRKTLDKNNCNRLETYFAARNLELKLLDCHDVIPDQIILNKHDHVSRATYFRLFFFPLIENGFDKIYYFDVDMLVLTNIDELFALDFPSDIAAVDHYSPEDEVRLWGREGGTYFNAGLLVYNMKKIDRHLLAERYKSILINHKDKIKWHDQDVLNMAHGDQWHRLPYVYNVNRSTITALYPSKETIKIIHYDGWNKPWIFNVARRYEDLWLEAYRDLYKRKHPKLQILNRINQYIFVLKQVLKQSLIFLKSFKG